MTVSSKTEDALRQAMQRLFDGNAQHTDGKLTKNNLCREAGVSRATMNRAAEVLAEWDSHVASSPAGILEQQHHAEIADLRSQLRSQLRRSRNECHILQDQVDAAATVIMTLVAENTALREQTDRSAAVIPLPRGRAQAGKAPKS